MDDTGIDEMILILCKIMMKDMNLSVISPFKQASQESLTWSEERAALKTANIGLGLLSIKSKKVLFIALNSSVVSKFTEALSSSEYELEAVGSVDLCEEELKSQGANIFALVLPHSASSTQQNATKQLAGKSGVYKVH